jgi:hypothetical protein
MRSIDILLNKMFRWALLQYSRTEEESKRKSKKKHCFRSASNLFGRLDRAGNLTGTQTAGTNIDMAGRTIDDSLHALDVGLPGTIGTTVRVGNSDTERNTLVAKLALCHPLHLLAVIKSRLGHSQAVDTITDCITKCKYYFQKR